MVLLLKECTYVPLLMDVDGQERSFLHMLYDLSTSRETDPIDPVPYIMRLIQDVNEQNPNEPRTRVMRRVERTNPRSQNDPVVENEHDILHSDQEVLVFSLSC